MIAQAAPKLDAPLRVVVVDDEPLAREDIIHALRDRQDVTVVAICDSGAAAVRAVKRHHPDVLLLDIHMPAPDGFSVVAQLERDEMPYVVFVTAFDRYAIDAFRVRALDYVLKPVQPARLAAALSRARDLLRMRLVVDWAAALQIAAQEQVGQRLSAAAAPQFWTEIMVRTGLRDFVIRVEDIDWIEADTYYARLHVGSRSYLLRERMHILEARLNPAQFARVHRSAIVNLSRVAEIANDGRGDHVLVMSTGARVRTSHPRWLEFYAVMQQRLRPDRT